MFSLAELFWGEMMSSIVGITGCGTVSQENLLYERGTLSSKLKMYLDN